MVGPELGSILSNCAFLKSPKYLNGFFASTQSSPFKETEKGTLINSVLLGGASQTILTVERNSPSTISSPNLQKGFTPYSGLYWNHAPMTITLAPPVEIDPEG